MKYFAVLLILFIRVTCLNLGAQDPTGGVSVVNLKHVSDPQTSGCTDALPTSDYVRSGSFFLASLFLGRVVRFIAQAGSSCRRGHRSCLFLRSWAH
jgi:hypothetical protein